METIVLRPGDEIPDNPQIQATLVINRSMQAAGGELIANLRTAMSETEALICTISGMLSAVVNIGGQHGVQEALALQLCQAAIQVRPKQASDVVCQLTMNVIDMANALLEDNPRAAVTLALLNAAANSGGHDRPQLVALLRELADRMEDPDQVAEAQARAELALRPSDAVKH